VADSRSPRDGRFIENIGKYHPMAEPSLIEIDQDRALHWLERGAQPTAQVENLIKILGIRDAFDAAHPKPARSGKGATRSASRQAAATSS